MIAVDIAKYLIVVPALCAVYYLWKLPARQRRSYLWLLIVGGLLSILVAKIASKLYNDPRPFIKDGITPLFHASRDNGFPSDHTLFSAFIGFATYFYAKRVGLALLVIAALIGWARVYSGVHHLVDIIGSFVITGVVAWLVHWAFTKRKDKHSHLDAVQGRSE